MKIAQVAPLYESVPPKLYGGTERVVSYLTEELVRQGQEVTLFASGDSVTSATLVAPRAAAIRLDETCQDKLANHVLMIERVVQAAAQFDVIHFHIDYLHFPLVRRLATPTLTTLHGRQDRKELADLYREFSDIPIASISEHQRRPIPWANWRGTVHHGLPRGLFAYQDKPGDYLAFLGRISREKRVDLAIEIAKRARMKIRIAAKVDESDEDYFFEEIRPLLNHPLVEYVGEIGENEKSEFLGNARALLFPIDWPEPFGLVMIEAMACGTPVIAFPRGSVPEIVVNGVNGFVVEGVDDAVQAVGRLDQLDRGRCRQFFLEKFEARRMAASYLRIYDDLIQKESLGGAHGRRHPAPR